MKKLLTLFFFFSLCAVNFAQTNFKWELTDSTAKTKTQIYADTKLFIAEAWNSAKDVIQNDDKENGIVLIKGLSKSRITGVWGYSDYYFSYTVQFRMKDGKYRITLDNVDYDNAITTSTSKPSPLSLDGFQGAFKDGMTEKNYNKVIEGLKDNLNTLVLSYQSYMKKPTVAIADNF